MKSLWIGVALNPVTGVLRRGGENREIHRGQSHAGTEEAETRRWNAGSYQQVGEGVRTDSPPEPPGGANVVTPSPAACGLQNMGEPIPVVLSHPVCGILLSSHREPTHLDRQLAHLLLATWAS